MLERKPVQHGWMDLTKNPDFSAGNDDVSPAPFNECRVGRLLCSIIERELVDTASAVAYASEKSASG